MNDCSERQNLGYFCVIILINYMHLKNCSNVLSHNILILMILIIKLLDHFLSDCLGPSWSHGGFWCGSYSLLSGRRFNTRGTK